MFKIGDRITFNTKLSTTYIVTGANSVLEVIRVSEQGLFDYEDIEVRVIKGSLPNNEGRTFWVQSSHFIFLRPKKHIKYNLPDWW